MSRLSLFRVASSLHILYSPAGQLLPVERWHYFDILGPTCFFLLAGKLEKINGEANVIESDVSATNGVVHFIDRILTDIVF